MSSPINQEPQQSSPITNLIHSGSEIPTPEQGTSGEPDNHSSFPVTIVTVAESLALTASIVTALVLVVVATVTVSLTVCLIVRLAKVKQAAAPVATNQAHGVTLQDVATHTEEGAHSNSAVPDSTITEAKQNDDTYATNIVTEGNEAYATITEGNHSYTTISDIVPGGNEVYTAVTESDIVTGRNEAYATNIVTGGNEAYATNIVTGRNEAYATSIVTRGNEAYITNVTVGNEAYAVTDIVTRGNEVNTSYKHY